MKKIFIVDDEPDILKVVTIRLKNAGYELAIAVDALQALETVVQNKPDLIIMDYRLPGMNGLDCCKKIREIPEVKDTPILFMTASLATIDLSVLKEAAINDHIAKPFEAPDLLEKIKKLIG